MHIPTLFLRSDQPALFCLDGAALGEAGSDQPLSLTVAPDGTYYVSAQPLVCGFMGITRRLDFENGKLQKAPDNCTARLWPGGTVELTLNLPVAQSERSYQPAMSLSVKQVGRMTATLFREHGIHLAIDNGEDLIFSHTVAADGNARMEVLQTGNHCLLYIVSKSSLGMHCLCVKMGSEPQIAFEATGDYFTRNDLLVTKITSLKSRRGHESKEIFKLTTGELSSIAVGYFTKDPEPATSAEHTCIDLLDAVRLGMMGEISPMLGGQLEDLALEDLRDFFGGLSTICFPPAAVSGGCLIGIGDDSPLTEMRVYQFETVEEGGKWQIINATEV